MFNYTLKSITCDLIRGCGPRIQDTVRPNFIASHKPTHLFRTDAKQQLAFFSRVEPSLRLEYWQIYETGWPYASGGAIKRAMAGLAKVLGGKQLLGATFGNRFRGLFIYQTSPDGLAQPGSVK